MNEGSTSTQANGFFGAYIKLAGFDGVVIQGRAPKLSYLLIDDNMAEIRDATHLKAKNSWETEDLIKQEIGQNPRSVSVLSIGPAGENRVRFAAIFGDRGHVAAHNGPGAVMGSKNLKAIVAVRGKTRVELFDEPRLARLASEMYQKVRESKTFKSGTLWIMSRNARNGRAPFLNYSTAVNKMTETQLNTFTPEYLKHNLKLLKRNPCWACPSDHCHIIRVPEGTYEGMEAEMPEYEGFAAMGSLLGIWDGITASALCVEVDRLGMDVNEVGWLLGMVIECYEKGLLNKHDTDGIEMKWGNVASIRSMIHKIAYREGFGDVLAEGVMRAAKTIGRDAIKYAVHTRKGNTPRTHDHRRIWTYLLDTCVSNTGSSEAGVTTDPNPFGLIEPSGPFEHLEIAKFVANIKGHHPLIDSMVLCIFVNRGLPDMLTNMLDAATGWSLPWDALMDTGQRAVNLLRALNIRQGFGRDDDAPSPRYGSQIPDGQDAGIGIEAVWNEMLDTYYDEMGWDSTGRPLPKTLLQLGLPDVAADLWPA